MQTFLQDLRYGLRLMARSPGFTAITVAALAIGIGANLTIFGFAKELLLSAPRGVADSARVVRVFTNRFSATAYANYEIYRGRNHTFLGLAAFRGESMSLRIDAAPEQRFSNAVSGNYFSTLGVGASIGRPILPSDDRPGAPDVVLLSHRFWLTRFGADPQRIGRALTINGRPHTIIGVAPADFTGTYAPLVPDFWTVASPPAAGERNSVQLIGRLRPDASVAEAQANLLTLAAQAETRPDPDARPPIVTVYQARTLAPEIAMPAAIFAGFLLAVVGLVLLTACVNIANLLLARSTARRREIGVRLALGASRGRLVRQLLTESLLLASAGGAAAVALAVAAARPIGAAAASLPVGRPIGLDFTVDWGLLAAAVGITVATTMAFGLTPALQSSKGDVLPALKATAGSTRSRVRTTFMVAQVAMSTLLLVLAGLLVRGLLSAHTLDRGFVAEGVLAASVDLQSGGYTRERGGAFYETLLDRLAQTPAIASAAVVDIVPLTLSNRASGMVKEGQDPSAPVPGSLVYQAGVSRGHFRTLGIPLVAGREFEARDRDGSARVAVVNQTLATRFWPGESPLGRRLRAQGGPPTTSPWLEVVGVVRDSKYVTVGEDPKSFLYLPLAQSYTPAGTILVKATGRLDGALAGLRRAVGELDPNLPLFNVTTIVDATSISLLPVRVAAALAGTLGLLALALGTMGLYGVMTYLVRQRTREIGIRIALGADPRAVVRLVTRDGMRWTAIGLAVGLIASLIVAKLIAGFLYGVPFADPLSFIGITALLAATAYTACYLPARHASRIDPLVALRDE